MSEKSKRGRGGDVKKNNAPPGYYTAAQAQDRLGMNGSSFRYYVRQGKIRRYVPPLRTEGFYLKEEINQLATQVELFLHASVEEIATTEVRLAQPCDANGIVGVLTARGWRTTTPEQRLGWYKVNPYIDLVALWQGEVMGYINAVPYTPEALEDIMSGKRRGWDMRPDDILPYQPGRTYDVFIGIVTRTDVPSHTQRFGFRLISGYLDFLEELAAKDILVHRIYAVSAEKDGQKLSRALGFVELPAQAGDLFPRFMIDMQTSSLRFAQRYREAVKRAKESR